MSDFSATANAEGKAITNTNFTVTATSSASANSNVSYEDALNTATNLAVNYANETAKYDANLINQSTDISTYLINYNTKQINSAPDLTFYYSMNTKYLKSYQSNLGTFGVEQWIETYLFSDIDLTTKIGLVTAEVNIYTSLSNNQNLFPIMSSRSFNLPNGNLFYVAQGDVYKNSDGNYIYPDNNYTYQIISGSGEYLNKTGIITLNADSGKLLRSINVYFNNN